MLTAEQVKQKRIEYEELLKKRKEEEIILRKQDFAHRVEALLIDNGKVNIALGEKDVVINNSEVHWRYVYDDNFHDELVKNGFVVTRVENNVTISL